MGAKFDIGTQGKITKEGVGYGAAGNVAFAGIGKVAKKAYDTVTNKLPSKLTLQGLINPGKLDAVKKTLQVEEGVASPEDVGKWLISRIQPGDKESIANQLLTHSKNAKQAVDDILQRIPDKVESKSAMKALEQLFDDFSRIPGKEADAERIATLALNAEKNGGKLSLSEMNAVKRELDDAYRMFNQTGDATAGIRADGLRNIRAEIRKSIEDTAEKYGVNIRQLNNETAVARGLAEGIMKKDNADNVRELLSAFAPSGFGGIAGIAQ